MPLLYLPVSSCCVGLQTYGICILGCWWTCTHYFEQGSTTTKTYYADLNRKVGVALKERKWGKLSQSAVPPKQCTYSHIIWRTGCHLKCWIRTTSPPDLSPSDYYLFPKLKKFMKGNKFADNEDKNGWLKNHGQQFFYLESELWRNAGPSAFQPQETMLTKNMMYISYY